MSSPSDTWPWMKGIATAIADPIDPVTPDDVRESVKDLITQHRSKIDKIVEALKDDPLYTPTKHDDLWILRFWLSHKKSKAAIQAAQHTLKFRQEHGLDEVDFRALPAPHKMEHDERVKEYWTKRCPGDSLVLTQPHPQRGVVDFVSIPHLVPGCSENGVLDQDTWNWAFIVTSEWAHQRLDYVTRTTGRLTKSIRFLDMKGISMKAIRRKDMKWDGEIMGTMEDCYPQLLASIKVYNAPTFIQVIWSLARAIVPKRVVEKFDIIEPATNEKQLKSLLRYLSKEQLPVKLGGSNQVLPVDW